MFRRSTWNGVGMAQKAKKPVNILFTGFFNQVLIPAERERDSNL